KDVRPVRPLSPDQHFDVNWLIGHDTPSPFISSRKSSLALTPAVQANRQIQQFAEQLPQEIEGRLISEAALRIEFCLSVCDVHVWGIHGNHIQRHADVAEMKLPACSTERAH